jgi:hypothetical protein
MMGGRRPLKAIGGPARQDAKAGGRAARTPVTNWPAGGIPTEERSGSVHGPQNLCQGPVGRPSVCAGRNRCGDGDDHRASCGQGPGVAKQLHCGGGVESLPNLLPPGSPGADGVVPAAAAAIAAANAAIAARLSPPAVWQIIDGEGTKELA